MAVIQISKIQVRRGQTAQTNFPQLASGEFGWSIDQQELYIGNGAVSEGAPAVGNTKILTLSDITNLFLVTNVEYQYRGGLIETGTPGNPVFRSVQDRLDDHVSLAEFGAVGDGQTDDTAAIQRAITNLYSNTNHTIYGNRVPLIFPAGNYVVTATIYIPPFAEIRGAGTQKTVISNASTSTIFQTQDYSGSKFSDGGMGSSAATPRNISISGITFSSPGAIADPMVRLDCLQDSNITRCEFIGSTGTTTATSTLAAGIEIRGQGAFNSDNILIEDCVFTKLSSAVVSNYDINNIKIVKNKFKNLDRGVVLAEAVSIATTGSYYGPTNVSVVENAFTNINRQGLYVGSTTTGSNVTSVDNTYENVGNNGNTQGDFIQSTDVITFKSPGNSSQGDNFSRLAYLNGSNFSTSTNAKPVISGPAEFNSRVATPVSFNGQGVYTAVRYPWSTSTNGQTIIMDYTLTKSDLIIRRGQLSVLIATTPIVRDEFSYAGLNDGYVTFTATVNQTRNIVNIIMNHSAGSAGTLSYTYTVRQ